MLLEGRQVILFDTPGFDDTYRLDADILAELAETLSALYVHKLKLAGIIYLHRITDNRMTNTLLRNLSVIRNLCGDEPLKNVTLLTTHWDTEKRAVAEEREKQMMETEDWWGYMVSKGSKVRRFKNTEESAHDVLFDFMDKERIVLQIQKEIVEQGLDVKQTQAGAALNVEVAQLVEKHSQDLAALEDKMTQAMQSRDLELQDLLERERKEKEKELARMQREQLAMERDRSEDMRRMEQAFQDQLLRLVEDRKEREAQLLQLQQELTLERADSNRRVQEAFEASESNIEKITNQFHALRAEDRDKYAQELRDYKAERDEAISKHQKEMALANAELVRMMEEKQSADDAERLRIEEEMAKLKKAKKKSKAVLWAKIGGAAACAVLAPFTGGLTMLGLPAFSSM